MSNPIMRFNRYRHYSQQAASAERQQKWAEAIKAWEVAALNAVGDNLKWCINRRLFCEKMARKPF